VFSVDNAHLSPRVGSIFITFYLQKANILLNSQRRVYVLACLGLSLSLSLSLSPGGPKVRDLHFKNASLLSSLFHIHSFIFTAFYFASSPKNRAPPRFIYRPSLSLSLPLAIWKMQTKMEFENLITIGAL